MARDSTRTSEVVENALQGLPSRGSDTWECIHGLLFPLLGIAPGMVHSSRSGLKVVLTPTEPSTTSKMKEQVTTGM